MLLPQMLGVKLKRVLVSRVLKPTKRGTPESLNWTGSPSPTQIVFLHSPPSQLLRHKHEADDLVESTLNFWKTSTLGGSFVLYLGESLKCSIARRPAHLLRKCNRALSKHCLFVYLSKTIKVMAAA